MIDPQSIERFWSKVDKNGPAVNSELGPCWIWTAGISSQTGYGKFKLNHKTIGAHRVAMLIADGHWPFQALHRCDVRRCVRREHLFDGDQRVNLNDCVSKGRQNNALGERHGQARLTDAAVREIRASNETTSELAARFGVAYITAYDARTGKTWRHVR